MIAVRACLCSAALLLAGCGGQTSAFRVPGMDEYNTQQQSGADATPTGPDRPVDHVFARLGQGR